MKIQKPIPNDRQRTRLDQLARGAKIRGWMNENESTYKVVWTDAGAKPSKVSPNMFNSLLDNKWIRKVSTGSPLYIISAEGRKALDKKNYS